MSEEKDSEGSEKTLLYQDATYSILGACFAVYKEKGCGFLEAVYQECLEIELAARNIPFVPQPQLQLTYRGQTLQQTYIPDFLCCDKIIVELKAVTNLAPEHRAQLMNYLKATNLEVGLLVNFGHYPKIEHERLICATGRYARL